MLEDHMDKEKLNEKFNELQIQKITINYSFLEFFKYMAKLDNIDLENLLKRFFDKLTEECVENYETLLNEIIELPNFKSIDTTTLL